MRITLRVNTREHTVDVPAQMPLLWVLRDVIGLTGTKYGCGIGQCGACTVLIDGVAQRSCGLPAAQASGKAITTIEGLGEGGVHAVQQAWIDEQVPQCGYCQPGQIMAAASLLAHTPKTSADDIDSISNICRCGTYLRIRRAINRAATKP
jgi:isoquinoline 1-oxidoreductase alpha subunit